MKIWNDTLVESLEEQPIKVRHQMLKIHHAETLIAVLKCMRYSLPLTGKDFRARRVLHSTENRYNLRKAMAQEVAKS